MPAKYQMTKTPIYAKIEAWLREEATHRGPGALMPTVAEVCDVFNVSGVQTVRSGYAPLIADGTVKRLNAPRRWAVTSTVEQKARDAVDPRASLAEIQEKVSELQTLLDALRRQL
jgi:DNA-binding GntR family transcriptional regulator